MCYNLVKEKKCFSRHVFVKGTCVCDNFHGITISVVIIVVSVRLPFPDNDLFYETCRVFQLCLKR